MARTNPDFFNRFRHGIPAAMRGAGQMAWNYARQISGTAQSIAASAFSARNMFEPAPANPVLGTQMPSPEVVTLNPLMHRKALPMRLTNLPFSKVGWVQMPGVRRFALGYFMPRQRFATLAIADDSGDVYITGDLFANVQMREPDMHFDVSSILLAKDSADHDGSHDHRAASTRGTGHSLVGDIYGKDGNGGMTWLANFLKSSNRYAFVNSRIDLSEEQQGDLTYRDFVTIAFFQLYLTTIANGGVQGFGARNILTNFRKLSPLAAIRASIAQTQRADELGMHVSGLERYFAESMQQISAMHDLSGLEADHGSEPLYMIEAPGSHSRFLLWENRMSYDDMLLSLQLEGTINRFLLIDEWLEYDAGQGMLPIEDDVSLAQVARIDERLLTNPSLSAIPPLQPVHILDEPNAFRIDDYMAFGKAMAVSTLNEGAAQSPNAVATWHGASGDEDEWTYRHALANSIYALRLPCRFDTVFRSNLEQGDVAFAFTTASRALMPESRYDNASGRMQPLDDAQRARISAQYNLQVGLIFTALAFATDEHVQRVSLRADSIGLEEAVFERDNAIKTLMDNALHQFTDLTNPIEYASQSTAKTSKKNGVEFESQQDDHAGGDGQEPDLDQELRDLLAQDGAKTTSEDGVDADHANSGIDVQEQLNKLQENPSMKHLLTVTFERDAFLDYMRAHACSNPFDVYRAFDATFDFDEHEGLRPIEPTFTLEDGRFMAGDSYTIPEHRDEPLNAIGRRFLGASNVRGLSISRDELFAGTLDLIRQMQDDESMRADQKATHAMELIESSADPELERQATQITTAIIDGTPIPQITSTVDSTLDEARRKAQDMAFNGDEEGAVAHIEQTIDELDSMFAQGDRVPRYFTSYTDRVVYNKLFATPDEHVTLIPDSLFQAHLDISEVLFRLGKNERANEHLNRLVSYAPATASVHIQQAIRFFGQEDWASVKAAALNALRVAADPVDASTAYFYLACACWMHDETMLAISAGLLSVSLTLNVPDSQRAELDRFRRLALSQGLELPQTAAQAVDVLTRNGVPVWPQVECAPIIRDAAYIATNAKVFPVAQALNVSWYALGGGAVGMNAMQFLRSLSI